MLFDPTIRSVSPFLIRTRIRTMRKLVLALTIHDKNVTTARPARVSLIATTGRTLPFEGRLGSKAHCALQTAVHHRCAIPHAETFPDRRFRFAAVGTSPSTHHGFHGRAIALHNRVSSGQHRFPDCGPTAVPRPHANEQEHEESGRDRPCCRKKTFLNPISSCSSFLQRCPTNPIPNFSARSKWHGREERRRKAGHHVRTPWNDFHCLGNRQAEVTNASCPRLNMQSSWCLL